MHDVGDSVGVGTFTDSCRKCPQCREVRVLHDMFACTIINILESIPRPSVHMNRSHGMVCNNDYRVFFCREINISVQV
jgi:hypothetical protein